MKKKNKVVKELPGEFVVPAGVEIEFVSIDCAKIDRVLVNGTIRRMHIDGVLQSLSIGVGGSVGTFLAQRDGSTFGEITNRIFKGQK